MHFWLAIYPWYIKLPIHLTVMDVYSTCTANQKCCFQQENDISFLIHVAIWLWIIAIRWELLAWHSWDIIMYAVLCHELLLSEPYATVWWIILFLHKIRMHSLSVPHMNLQEQEDKNIMQVAIVCAQLINWKWKSRWKFQCGSLNTVHTQRGKNLWFKI